MLRRATLFALLLAAGGCGAADGKPVVHTVVIEAMAFSPQVLEVRRGDVIVWVNKDAFPHDATAENRAFASGPIAPGGSWRHVAANTGSLAYICSLHPVMKARLVVK